MSLTTLFVLIISSFVMITSTRTLNTPDQLMPLILSSVNPDGNGFMSPSNSQNRLIIVIEQIIKLVVFFLWHFFHDIDSFSFELN